MPHVLAEGCILVEARSPILRLKALNSSMQRVPGRAQNIEGSLVLQRRSGFRRSGDFYRRWPIGKEANVRRNPVHRDANGCK